MSDSQTPVLTAEQIAAEESNRNILARALAAKSAAFEAQSQPVITAAPEPKTPLAAALSKLSAPAPIAPPRDLALTQMQLAPLLTKARALVRRFDELRDEIGDKAGDYSALDMARIVKLIPPTTDSLNWARLASLIGASKDISVILSASNYSSMQRTIGVAQQFHDGAITDWSDPQDRKTVIYNAGVAVRFMEDQVKKFENTVSALANAIRTVVDLEPKVAADLVLVCAAPVVPEAAPERLALNQKLPKDRPTSSFIDFDPRQPEPQRDDSVRVEKIADGFHTTTVNRKAE